MFRPHKEPPQSFVMVSNRLNYLPALSSKTGESQEETAFTVKRARALLVPNHSGLWGGKWSCEAPGEMGDCAAGPGSPALLLQNYLE